jgi:hypothetical protein
MVFPLSCYENQYGMLHRESPDAFPENSKNVSLDISPFLYLISGNSDGKGVSEDVILLR